MPIHSTTDSHFFAGLLSHIALLLLLLIHPAEQLRIRLDMHQRPRKPPQEYSLAITLRDNGEVSDIKKISTPIRVNIGEKWEGMNAVQKAEAQLAGYRAAWAIDSMDPECKEQLLRGVASIVETAAVTYAQQNSVCCEGDCNAADGPATQQKRSLKILCIRPYMEDLGLVYEAIFVPCDKGAKERIEERRSDAVGLTGACPTLINPHSIDGAMALGETEGYIRIFQPDLVLYTLHLFKTTKYGDDSLDSGGVRDDVQAEVSKKCQIMNATQPTQGKTVVSINKCTGETSLFALEESIAGQQTSLHRNPPRLRDGLIWDVFLAEGQKSP